MSFLCKWLRIDISILLILCFTGLICYTFYFGFGVVFNILLIATFVLFVLKLLMDCVIERLDFESM